MSQMKKKIEKYIQADQIGKEEENQAPDKRTPGDAAVKIQIESDADLKKADAADAGAEPYPAPPTERAREPGEPLKQELETVRQEAKENHDRYLRVYAEFENYRKRTARENEEFRKFANESLIKELLGVVDNLERAVESSATQPDNEARIIEGVQMTLKEILSILEKFQVTPIEAVGKPFDPRYHQAFQQEENDEYPENTVVKEFQKGYLLHDRLLRPSMVVVSKKKESTGAKPEKDTNNV